MPEQKFDPRNNEFIRFLIAGSINTLFGFVVYTICILGGVPVWLSLLAGMLSGTVFNFFTTGGYVFRDLAWVRFPRFALCYFFIYATNLLLIDLLSPWLDSKIMAQAIITFPLAVLSYFMMAQWVFPQDR